MIAYTSAHPPQGAPRPGDRVDVNWRAKNDGLHFFDCPPWTGKRVVALTRVCTGEWVAWLEGHPCCPVRVERLSPSAPAADQS